MTIRELCSDVARTGILDITEEKAVMYQDLIGHATEGELGDLSNTPALTESFYRIYGTAYGTVAAIKFYLRYSDYVTSLKEDVEAEKIKTEEARTRNKNLNERVKYWENLAEERKGQLREAKRDMEGTLISLKDKEKEITMLKARMYDLEHKEDKR